MTGKSRQPYKRPATTEVGIMGPMSDDAKATHFAGIRQGQIGQAKRRSEGHEDGCRCGDCLWLDEIGGRS